MNTGPNYPAYKVNRINGCASYYLIASPTNCIEFVEQRQAGNEFGFLIRTLKSRTVVKQREANSSHMDKDLWFAEVKASMLAHLECAMDMVAQCNAIRYIKQRPRLGDYQGVAAEAQEKFAAAKRGLARMMLIDAGAAEDAGQANRMIDIGGH